MPTTSGPSVTRISTLPKPRVTAGGGKVMIHATGAWSTCASPTRGGKGSSRAEVKFATRWRCNVSACEETRCPSPYEGLGRSLQLHRGSLRRTHLAKGRGAGGETVAGPPHHGRQAQDGPHSAGVDRRAAHGGGAAPVG